MSKSAYKTYVVVNPASAGGRTGREWPALKALLDEGLNEWSFGMTTGPMTAPDLARRALKDGYEMIVSIGGDGTHNEVVNGFFDSGRLINPNSVFAVLPKGTGGDFRKTIGMVGDPPAVRRAALDRLRGRATQSIDCGELRFIDNAGNPALRYFINIASFGLGGEADEKVNTTTKMFGGKVSFFVGTLRAFVRYRNKRVRVKLDGRDFGERSIFNVAVANGQYFGAGMRVAPNAVPDDGWFDVVFLNGQGWKAVRQYTQTIYKGEHLGLPHVESARARKVEAESEDRVLLDVDGEQPGRLPATFTLLPKAIRLKALDSSDAESPRK